MKNYKIQLTNMEIEKLNKIIYLVPHSTFYDLVGEV
jgi:hypothetical protein